LTGSSCTDIYFQVGGYMPGFTFDTHESVKSLKAAGFNEAQAEALIAEFKKGHESGIAHLATKDDIKDTPQKIKEARKERIDIGMYQAAKIREDARIMIEVRVKIPEDMKDIIAGTNETIYVEALKEIARKKMPELQKRLRTINKKIKAYQLKYGVSYDEFSRSVPDTIKGHDDWIEWSYLVKLADELSTKTAKLSLLLGK